MMVTRGAGKGGGQKDIGGGGRGGGGGYRAPGYYMLTGIHNDVDMMWGYRYGHTNKFSHRSEQRTHNKASLTGMRHAPC